MSDAGLSKTGKQVTRIIAIALMAIGGLFALVGIVLGVAAMFSDPWMGAAFAAGWGVMGAIVLAFGWFILRGLNRQEGSA